MEIIHPHTTKGPSDQFTGDVYPTIILSGKEPSRVRMASVHFAPGARTAWHSHAVGQYIHVEEGAAYLQERGSDRIILRPGDTVYTEPDVEHWHGALPDCFMVHKVVWEAPDPNSNTEESTWLGHISDVEYNL